MPGMHPGDQGNPGGDPGDLGESRYRIRVGQVHGHRNAVRARAAQSLGDAGDLVALDVGEHQPARCERASLSLTARPMPSAGPTTTPTS